MDFFEGIDWEGIREFIQPLAGLVIALLFMGFVRLMKSSSRRRQQSPPEREEMSPQKMALPQSPARLQVPKQKVAVSAAPIEPGDDAAKLSSRYSQGPRP